MQIAELLANFRQIATTPKEQGDLFEELVCKILRHSPEYSQIERVVFWKDWARAKNIADIGIDLVVETRDGEFWAVQCKFYDSESTIPKEEIDSFLAAAGRDYSGRKFSRLLLYTTAPLSANARKEIEDRTPPVVLRRVDMFDDSLYDWERLYDVVKNRTDADFLRPKKSLRPHQLAALDAVKTGFESADRGKLIMACGTGKTLTSLRITETLAPDAGLVLYLVPSLTLLAQTLHEWTRESNRPLAPIIVCSDSQIHRQDSRRNAALVGKSKSKKKETLENDEPEFDPVQFSHPATTKPEIVAERWQKIRESQDAPLTVVFSTYQSIQVISDAQKIGLPAFDLIVCDEAHRTTGVSLGSKDESAFVKVHDNNVISGKKRLYMTATPRVYGDFARQKIKEQNAELCSMDDEALYGKDFFTLSFGDAVQQGLLADYKVSILVVGEDYARKYLSQCQTVSEVAESGELKRADAGRDLDVDDVAKMIGCWRGLNKQSKFDGAPVNENDDFAADPAPMRRAVAFCRSIKDSKEFARAFKILGDKLLEEERAAQIADEDAAASKRAEDAERRDAFLTHSGRSNAEEKSAESERVAEVGVFAPKRPASVEIETEHVDGTFPADEREKLLRWLREDSDKNACRVLSNVRCLSEGVDVPNLDAALFLSPRASQVDVVQAVGRVMRLAPGKKFGYVVIPIVISENVDPEEALDDNERYKVVWQTLQAIRSHDDRFRVLINQLQVGEKSSKLHVQVIGEGGGTDGGSAQTTIQTDGDKKNEKTSKGKEKAQESSRYFPGFFDSVHPIEKAIRARVVKKCGDRNYLDQWARDVAKITAGRIDGIRARLENPTSEQEAAFNSLLAALRREINPNVDKEQALDMVAQHLTTLPVFDALFSDAAFSRNNPVAKRIQATVDAFNLSLTPEEQEQERRFQEDVRAQIDGIRTARGRQAVIHKLYEQFFSVALPKMAEKLGVVYTPPEVVDYILRSVDYVLQQEFGRRLTNKDVHILDPFAGTGAFISRLLESGLIDPTDLRRKYREELHANEIMPLAYYIAAVNIEEAYCAAFGDNVEYEPFPGVVLTDTFQTTETTPEPIYKLACDNPTNGKRLKKQRHTTIQVIVGNPPYSVGQKSVNDNNQNEKYPKLDARIAETYAAKSSAIQKKSLYDSYIKAFRWASDRISTQGVVAFVSNGAYIDNNAMEGFRKSLVDEFASIYVFNLRGNQRTQGELSRKEGGKIFGSGSRTPVAITILVKKPHIGGAKIFYRDIGDYLSREQKLGIISEFGSVEKTTWAEITPNELGDWINQRSGDFGKLIPLDNKDSKNVTFKFFGFRSCGVLTARDAWVYHFSKKGLIDNVSRMIEFYNSQVEDFSIQTEKLDAGDFVCQDHKKISWSYSLLKSLKNGKRFEEEVINSLRVGTYRPFCKENLFFNKLFNERPSQISILFPTPSTENLVICMPAVGTKGFSVIVTNQIPDLEIERGSLCFPRYYYEPLENTTLLPSEEQVIIDGYVQRHAITDGIFKKARELYGEKVDKDDIFFYVYGALHSESYRRKYESELKKELARLPLPSSGVFWQCSAIGRELADVHLNYETGKSTIGDREGKPFKKLSPVPLRIEQKAPEGLSDAALYRVEKKMRLGTKTERQEDGTTRKVFDGSLKYNDYLSFHGIPLESFEYVVNGRSPLEWLVERYYCKEDKASGIVDDPNEWSDDPRYIFDLIPRLVAVSLRTLELTSQLPDLE